MLTPEDARFFVEPAVDSSKKSTTILCLDTRNQGRQEGYIGKIVDVRAQREMISGRMYAVTADGGNYVFGSPQIEAHGGSLGMNHALTFLPDGSFAVGNLGRDTSNTVVISSPRFSKPNILDLPGVNIPSLRYYKAAQWAYELMPSKGDTQEMVDAKLELAKERYKQRRAFFHLHEEAVARNWGPTMDELREMNSLIPAPRYGAKVSGMVFIQSRSTIPDTVRAAVSEAAKATLSGVDASVVGYSAVGSATSVEFTIAGDFATQEEARAISDQDVASAWRRLGNAEGTIFSSSKSPFISGMNY